MSEQVKKQDRQFLGANTPIVAKNKCFKYKGANKQKNEILGITNVMSEQVKMPNRHFLRCDIFTFVIPRISFFRLFLQLKALIR